MTNTTTSALATPARWGGCATLNPDDPKLWVVPATKDAGGDVQGFSLAEVIEAGLRQKVLGLSDADRDAAIADCVADTLHHIISLSRDLTEVVRLARAKCEGASLEARA